MRVFDLQLFGEEKTEPATPRRRGKAREEGQVCQSKDLNAVVEILVGLIVIALYADYAIRRLMAWLQDVVSYIGSGTLNNEGWINWLFESATFVYFLCWLPIGFFAAIAAVIVIVRQIGWKITFKPFELKLDRLNPITGLKKIISLRSLVELLKGLFKASVFAWVIYIAIRDKLPEAVNSLKIPFESGVAMLGDQLWWLAVRLAFFLLIVAVLDYAYQKWDFEKKLRMSKHDIKEEHKQTEGDPQIKSKIKQRQRELARRRMMSSVPKSDVVITNPTTLAIALHYDRELMQAPIVLAKGKGLIARKIRDIAIEHGIPVLERKPLVWALYESAEIGDEIPAEFYKAIAEVLAFVYKLKKGK
ncbi:MAG: flagellar biosynthesis protein FlhB [Synergistaceae bacterium]|nr:flagellar biosynthesis protein FlhB [Synergistaceae bacterium]